DTVMVLDELGMVEARDAAPALYGLANGQGKQRAARDGSPREPKSWRVLMLSSGEVPVEAKLSEAPGRKPRAGQLVRLLDMPAERGKRFGVFDNGGPDGDGGALAKEAIETVRLFIEQHGDARFEPIDDASVRPVANRAGYREGSGADREWWILPEVWKTDVCS